MLWTHRSYELGLESIHRTKDFFNWRYVNNSGFRYLFFGEPGLTSVVIGRIEPFFVQDSSGLTSSLLAFRMIELLPNFTESWAGKGNETDIEFLRGVIEWCRLQGCCLVDYYNCSRRFEAMLSKAGFKRCGEDSSTPETNIATVFHPMKRTKRVMDVFFRVNNLDLLASERDFDDIYIVKSDADMDRPTTPNPAF